MFRRNRNCNGRWRKGSGEMRMETKVFKQGGLTRALSGKTRGLKDFRPRVVENGGKIRIFFRFTKINITFLLFNIFS